MITDLPIFLAGAFVGGFTLGLTGFGNGLTSYGLWLHVISPHLAAPLVAIGSLTGHLLMFRGLKHAIRVDRFLPFIIGGIAGVPIGTWFLTVISATAFKLFAGLLLASYSLLSLLGGRTTITLKTNRSMDGVVGVLGGVCGGLASSSGPILTVWCGLKGWSTDEQRGTYQPFNFAMHVCALVAFGVAGLLTITLFWLAVYSLPVSLVGIWLGRRLYGRVDERQFKRIILVLLTVSGLSLIWTGLM